MMINYSPVLQQADIFFDFTPDELGAVSKLCSEKAFSSGEWILEEYAPSDELYVIAEGRVEILVTPSMVSDQADPDSNPAVIATLHRGESFGEMALVDQGFRSAGVRAAANRTRLIVIPRQKLTELCETDLQIGYRLMRNLAADLALKMRSADLQIRESLL